MSNTMFHIRSGFRYRNLHQKALTFSPMCVFAHIS